MMEKYFVTGGAGFIGMNYVSRLLARGEEVCVYDNLSRRGAEKNVGWLRKQHGTGSFRLVTGDVRDKERLTEAMADSSVVVHLAGQVAVTTSVVEPREDFEINALGTFNVLEAARNNGKHPVLLYASTNKVYGGMEDVEVVEEADEYRYADYPQGIPESHLLDFHSPYGCSKGAGDQYVHDYSRIYDLPTVVLRQSCIYGPHQFGIEDQGWVAWFVIAAILKKPITIYGNGKQVRDILYVDDLLDMYDACIQNTTVSTGRIYNVGGGPENTLSIWMQFAPLLEELMGEKIDVKYAGWRPGDQFVYVSDIRKAAQELGWSPKHTVRSGIESLYRWIEANKELFVD